MTYPNLHASLRTDDDFVRQKDEDHHLPNRQSPLLELNIGLVSKCPLDYMHLTCLGIVRRIVSLWMEGDLYYRLPSVNTTYDKNAYKQSTFVILFLQVFLKFVMFYDVPNNN